VETSDNKLRIDAAIEAFGRGEIVVVADDDDRENEGDLFVAAAMCTPEKMAFIIRHTSGIVCAPLAVEDARRLRLDPMVSANDAPLGTAFTVSVDFRHGLTTGISAEERTNTVRALANGNTGAADFVRPGHVFPLIAKAGGVLMRSGHTEACVDLCRLAGLPGVGVLAELMNDDGTVMRGSGVAAFAAKHGLKSVSIADLISYRQAREKLVERISEFSVATEIGTLKGYAYVTPFDQVYHMACVYGRVGDGVNVPTRLHRANLINDVFGGAKPVEAVLRLEPAMSAAGKLPSGERPAAAMPACEIRLRDVTFGYSAGAPVLDHFDLTIPAGSSLAIVGQNGAGKTTLAKLLCRLYDPRSGAIEIDGVNLREFDLASWRSRVAAVFQDFIRLELSLRDNVAPAGAPDDVVSAALASAGATSLAALDTVLARGYDGGTDLSGGQWQRIALARALAAVTMGAGVVLLDEPTAQLDVRGEAEIFDRLLAATRHCTTILISHRFSTVRHADRICVLEHGRVIELGTHDELMAQGGRYRTMFDMQAQRFNIPEEEGATYDVLS